MFPHDTRVQKKFPHLGHQSFQKVPTLHKIAQTILKASLSQRMQHFVLHLTESSIFFQCGNFFKTYGVQWLSCAIPRNGAQCSAMVGSGHVRTFYDTPGVQQPCGNFYGVKTQNYRLGSHIVAIKAILNVGTWDFFFNLKIFWLKNFFQKIRICFYAHKWLNLKGLKKKIFFWTKRGSKGGQCFHVGT